ncbi:MAG TPA: hypothetical protein VHX99_04715 [Rhizomicrobium sp.]|jgi:hypothetical protein|nr:hypothetical protein [Rhizomicrobium sp.]
MDNMAAALARAHAHAMEFLDRYTEETIAAINDEGAPFFSPGTWQGRRMMRISVVNWRTSDDDVRRTVDAVARVLARRRAA